MSEEPGEAAESGKKPKGKEAAYLALGSAVLYALGYLSLRFELTALGVSTDLGVLDERYLFAGASFLVMLGTAIPNFLLLIGVPVALLWGVFRLVPQRLRGALAARGERLRVWWSDPARLAVTGILLSLGLVQIVMRKCIRYHDLLLAPSLPDDPLWPQQLLLDHDEVRRSLFFAGLVAGTAMTTWLLVAVHRRLAGADGRLFVVDRDHEAEPTPRLLGLRIVLASLVAVQFLLLPVNHGVLRASCSFPTVADPEGQLGLKSGETAWLVWEGHDTVTYLIRHGRPGAAERHLVTLLRREVKKIEITGSESIIRALFLPEADSVPLALETWRHSR